MLIRVYSLEYGKYLWEQGCAEKWYIGNFLGGKVFFVNMDVHFQNMAIRGCNYASQGAINSRKVIV